MQIGSPRHPALQKFALGSLRRPGCCNAARDKSSQGKRALSLPSRLTQTTGLPSTSAREVLCFGTTPLRGLLGQRPQGPLRQLTIFDWIHVRGHMTKLWYDLVDVAAKKASVGLIA